MSYYELGRKSIAFAASDLRNPNVSLAEYEERKHKTSIAEFRKDEITKAVPIDASGEVGGDEPDEEDIMDLLRPDFSSLLYTDQFFITKGNDDYLELFGINVPHMYNLLDSTGMRIFFVGETLEDYAGAYSPHRKLDFIILHCKGGLFFEIVGDTRSATVRQNGEPVGFISKPLFRNTYVVKSKEYTLFTVSPNGETPIDYDIRAIGFSEPIGRIKRKWPRNKDPDLQILYGMNLPHNLCEESKMLLVSVFIILYFYHLVPVGRGDNRKNFWLGFAFSAGVGFIITVMIVIIIISAIPKNKS